MIYTDNTKKAINLMYKYHDGQLDKSGLPYIFHPFSVAYDFEEEDLCIVALLHDIVEDTSCTFEELESMFSSEVVDAIRLMTHSDEDDYFSYIERLSDNRLASLVKISDLKHNSDESRLNNITQRDIKRNLKYKKALEILLNKWR